MDRATVSELLRTHILCYVSLSPHCRRLAAACCYKKLDSEVLPGMGFCLEREQAVEVFAKE